jgi:hypothetical protein
MKHNKAIVYLDKPFSIEIKTVLFSCQKNSNSLLEFLLDFSTKNEQFLDILYEKTKFKGLEFFQNSKFDILLNKYHFFKDSFLKEAIINNCIHLKFGYELYECGCFETYKDYFDENLEIKTKSLNLEQKLYKKIHSNENDLFNRKDLIKKAIISANKDESVLKSISDELDIFINDYDLFFDKKLRGEIHYL